jgi:hypothetical protein
MLGAALATPLQIVEYLDQRTEKRVQELVRDVNEQQTLDYCNNEVQRLVIAETRDFSAYEWRGLGP